MNVKNMALIIYFEFAWQQGLQFHIKRVHENTGKHFCDRCTFKAITKPELEIHINEVHTKAIKFHCSDCNFFCYRKGGLAAHVKNVHLKLRPHRCEVCGQAFVRRKELEKHKEWANHGWKQNTHKKTCNYCKKQLKKNLKFYFMTKDKTKYHTHNVTHPVNINVYIWYNI